MSKNPKKVFSSFQDAFGIKEKDNDTSVILKDGKPLNLKDENESEQKQNSCK